MRTSNLQQQLLALRPQLAAAAQRVLDAWQPDEDGVDEVFGSGGACDEICREMMDVVVNNVPGVEVVEGGQDGDDHAYFIAYDDENAFIVDIPPGVYETGAGYSWRKLPDVQVDAEDVVIESMDRRDLDFGLIEGRLYKHADGIGPELHAGGDFAVDERDVPGELKYPAEEGPKYRNRDTTYSTPGGRDQSDYPGGRAEFADVGELFEFTDLLHQTSARKETTVMSLEDDFLNTLGRVVQAAMSPSRDTTNIPANVIVDTRVRLENKVEQLEENGGELSNEDAGTLELLKSEEERRGIGASRRVQARYDEFSNVQCARCGFSEAGERFWSNEDGGWICKGCEVGEPYGNVSIFDVKDSDPAAVDRWRDSRMPQRQDELRVDLDRLVASGQMTQADADAYFDRISTQWARGIGASRRVQANNEMAAIERWRGTDGWRNAFQNGQREGREMVQKLTSRQASADEIHNVRADAHDSLVLAWNDFVQNGHLDEDAMITYRFNVGYSVALDDLADLGDGTLARRRVQAADENPFASDDDDSGDDTGDTPAASDDYEAAEDALIERIAEFLETLGDGVEALGDAVEELQGVQEAESDAGGADAADGDVDDDAGTGDSDNPFAGKSAAHWSDAIVAAMHPEPGPTFTGDGMAIGAVKEAANVTDNELFDVFAEGSERFHTAERSLAALAVNRRPEGRGRFVPPSPQLINAAAAIFRKAMAKLRSGYSIDSFDLERVVTHKVAATTGGLIDGEFIWHAVLADHARGRRGTIDLVMQIVGGEPLDGVQVIAGNKRISFTQLALDEHLNIRRDNTRWPQRYTNAERAFIPE